MKPREAFRNYGIKRPGAYGFFPFKTLLMSMGKGLAGKKIDSPDLASPEIQKTANQALNSFG